MGTEPPSCLTVADPDELAGGGRPWSPGRTRGRRGHRGRRPTGPDRIWCMAEVDIFRDLDDAEMDAMAPGRADADLRRRGTIFSPHQPLAALFILKQGRAPHLPGLDRRPGTDDGDHRAGHDLRRDGHRGPADARQLAEALDDAVVCVMTAATYPFLLSDPRISARITETLGRRLGDLERKFTDASSSPPPNASRGSGRAGREHRPPGPRRPRQVRLTHGQLAALVGTSRETVTKVLGDFADHGLVRLNRGRITLLDPARLQQFAG